MSHRERLGLLRLDIGRPDHLAPLLGFIRNDGGVGVSGLPQIAIEPDYDLPNLAIGQSDHGPLRLEDASGFRSDGQLGVGRPRQANYAIHLIGG
jgi:hypothetical protein